MTRRAHPKRHNDQTIGSTLRLALGLCLALGACSSAAQLTTGPSAKTLKLGYVYWRNATKRTQGSVVPLPKSMRPMGDQPGDFLAINPKSFDVQLAEEVGRCHIVAMARERYLKGYLFDDLAPEPKDLERVHGDQKQAAGSLLSLQVLHSSPSHGLAFECPSIPGENMDESYTLTISPVANLADQLPPLGQATLSAPTCWGVLRGLETFSQLVYNRGPNSFAIKPVAVVDSPRFAHRGLMLDTARHYIAVDKILDLLDAMSFNKLNVFHWHLVDDQSFPFVSHAYPQLSKLGAYRPDLIYSPADVQLVVLYAAARGIRVMPELDTPGHTYALRHITNLLSDCYDAQSGQPNGDFGPIDPTRATAYRTVNKLIGELFATFSDSHFHAGGDEVDFDCWKSNPDINKWMRARNMSGNYEELSNYYIRRVHNMVKNYNKTMVVWQEVFDMGAKLERDAVVHVWKDINNPSGFMRELSRVVEQGYRALLSSCWYLNYIDYGQDWVKFYQCNPTASPIREQDKRLVLGGEVCMWTEFVDDTNVISRTFPRASAAAERLWSPEAANNVEEFLHRLEQHRCRLVGRGINAEPVNGPGYC